MKMIDYILKKYPANSKIIVSPTENENIFLVTSFVLGKNGLDNITTFACTDGKVLLLYDPSVGELTKYDWVEDKWVYYSWTFSQKEWFNEFIQTADYKSFYNNFTGWLG